MFVEGISRRSIRVREGLYENSILNLRLRKGFGLGRERTESLRGSGLMGFRVFVQGLGFRL